MREKDRKFVERFLTQVDAMKASQWPQALAWAVLEVVRREETLSIAAIERELEDAPDRAGSLAVGKQRRPIFIQASREALKQLRSAAAGNQAEQGDGPYEEL